MKKERSQPSAYGKAVQLLATRTHFRRELESKLAARGYPPDEVAEALDRLAREGYLDDRRAASELVAGRLARGALGRRRLHAELARRGADPEAAEAALDELPEDDLEAAREAAGRWLRRRGKDSGEDDPEDSPAADPGSRRAGRPESRQAALARHLDRKGFSRRAIVAVLRESGGAAGEPFED